MQTNTILIFFIFLFIFFNKYAFSLKAIIYPFQYSFYNEPTSFEPEEIITYYNKNYLYITMQIGTPPLNITLILDDKESGFILKECYDYPESHYSISKSTSFKSDEGLNYQYINYELKTTLNNTSDKIYLNITNEDSLNGNSKRKLLNSIEIDEFNFLYLPTKEEIKNIKKYNDNKKTYLDIDKNKNKQIYIFSPKCGYIGLLPKELNQGLIYEKVNLFYQLKNKNIIDNYYWYIHFNDNNKVELIIGTTPHMIEPEKYSEDDLYMTHAKLVDDKFLWQIEFSSIDIEDINSNKKYNLGNEKGILSINDNFIFCPRNYFDNITYIFFQKYLDNDICKKEKIKKYNVVNTVIYCYQKYFQNKDLKYFPILSLKSNELNYIFKFDYNDLFLKTDQVYIFKIIYNLDVDYWKLGKTFLEKYQFIFNYDTKMFGVYYINNNKQVDINKEKNNNNMNKNDKEKIKIENESNYFKILIILGLVIFIIFVITFSLRKIIFSNKINSKNIEDYKESGGEENLINNK